MNNVDWEIKKLLNPMVTELFRKSVLQKALRDMRKAGFDVQKHSYGYKVLDGNELVLIASSGEQGYLTRYREGTFSW